MSVSESADDGRVSTTHAAAEAVGIIIAAAAAVGVYVAAVGSVGVPVAAAFAACIALVGAAIIIGGVWWVSGGDGR